MSKIIDLYVDQGTTFKAVLPPVTNPNGSVVDLTGYTVASQMRRSYATIYAVQITATIPNPTHGIIQLSLTDSQTAGLSPMRYVYDVVITDSSAVVTRIFEGLVTINPGVTNKPVTSLVIPYLPSDWGGI